MNAGARRGLPPTAGRCVTGSIPCHMTLFAGAVRVRSDRDLPSRYAATLRATLSREASDVPTMMEAPGAVVAHVDVGALGGRGLLQASSAQRVSLLAGEPLCSRSHQSSDRDQDLRELHEGWIAGRTDVLERARGSFSVVHVDLRERRLQLATDKLSLRPLYVAWVDDIVLFSTTLRVMLALEPSLATRPDWAAQAEMAALGGALSRRTAYADIVRLEGGTVLDVGAAGAAESVYHRFDDVPMSAAGEADFRHELHQAFVEAVRLRMGAERRVAAHLSGGLDSRLVVATLREAGAEVDTLNFAPEDSFDLVLGREAAQRLGSRHFEFSRGGTDFWVRMAQGHRAWESSVPQGDGPQRPSRVFTGFAGETVLAPTNLDAAIIAAMRRDDLEGATRHYLKRIGGALSPRLFHPEQRAVLGAAVASGVTAQLRRRSGPDAARRIHVFQLLSEPRANLARHHEDLDLRRFEFTLPFCDATFIEKVLSWPCDDLPRHSFYYRWLSQFPDAVRSVPWQAYPWSEPCPLPLPGGYRNQWADDWIHERELREELNDLVAQTVTAIRSPWFPARLLDRHNLGLACLLTRLGLRRYAYLLRHAQVFLRHTPR